MAFLNFILFNNSINRKVPPIAKAKAVSILGMEPELLNKIMENKIPILAESMVAAVVGETNLFLLICCIINPAILMLIPAISILINRGNLLWTSINNSISSNLCKLNILISFTPIKMDKIDKIISAKIKYLFFNTSPSPIPILLIHYPFSFIVPLPYAYLYF